MNEDVGGNTSALARTTELDINFIQRNIRDLAKTTQFSHLPELEELHNLAYTNLKKQMEPGQALALDPSLALKTYETLSGVMIQVADARRKATETFIKARVLVDVPKLAESLLDNEDLPHDEVSEASVGESGIYGKLAGRASANDPDISI